ncbi:hypothetical protein PC116_g20694 [Phytophthora cactorum]|nr:hypothetical protein PC114_g18869 [Phytophthora cactorum]KAG3051886.1 hypothetical protein PC121_g17589 [Phytophthora cactorum]KAG3187886.1 hypothetical protein PC128_g12437 [Phytophthora cactorum]KAG4231021.1 hypothetical protein PC116_g20694 [Phytophthora cactorum]
MESTGERGQLRAPCVVKEGATAAVSKKGVTEHPQAIYGVVLVLFCSSEAVYSRGGLCKVAKRRPWKIIIVL